jgi:hypothetical protein
MEKSLESKAKMLLTLYDEELRDFLDRQSVQGLDGLDRQADTLRAALKRPPQVSIGFIGESQVGKSTLINAVLDRHALPSGGIGPLTAQQTRIIHGAEDRLTVSYHGKGAINRLAFALAQNLLRRGNETIKRVDLTEIAKGAEFDTDSDIVLGDTVDEDAGNDGLTERAQQRAAYEFAQVRRMLGASPEISDAALLHGLFQILDRPLHGDQVIMEAFQERCAQIRDRMGKQETLSASQLGSPAAFQSELGLRAAGWLSPLVAQLSLELASAQVEGLDLTDLPGIGVSGDAGANEAQRFVETQGDALVMVLRNSGLTESVASLLEDTGVITKLLFAGRDGSASIQVILVITHLDSVAKTHFGVRAQLAIDSGTAMPDRHTVFRELAAEMERKAREQIASALLQSSAFENLEGSQESARRAAVTRLCDELRVICVVAPDYMEKKVGPDLELSFLKDLESTGVPTLRRALHQIAQAHRSRRMRDVQHAERALVSTLDAHLASLRKSLTEPHGVAHANWEHFCSELNAFAQPLRMEMQALHGEVAGSLRRGLLERIDALCSDAEKQGMKNLKILIREARKLSFQSLNAALRRDGVWELRGINFPNNLTYSFVNSIATEWEPRVVNEVKKEIGRLADRDIKLVEQLVNRAREIDSKIAEEAPIEEQKKILQQNSRSAVHWTKDQLEDLSETVRSRLRETVSKPIERACRKAIAAGRNTGTGAKERTIEAFDEGSGEALSEARDAAVKILRESYARLIRKLDASYLKDFHDPVQAALKALTDRSAARAIRSDKSKRKALTEGLGKYDAALSQLRRADSTQEEAA